MTEFVRTWPVCVSKCNMKRNSELYALLLTENYVDGRNTPTMATSRNGEGGYELHVTVTALGQEQRDLDTMFARVTSIPTKCHVID